MYLKNIYKMIYGAWYDGYTSADITYIPYFTKETDNTYEISIKLPGLDSQKIELFTEVNKLYILIDKNTEFYFYNESDDISSYRYIVLPEDSSLVDIKSTHTIGVLNIKIKKCLNLYQSNYIDVKSKINKIEMI